MDKSTREILQKTMRYLSDKGYRVLSEFALPNKKRVDIIGINSKKKIIIVEVKAKEKDLKTDKKWKNYLNYCNYFYFSCTEEIKKLDILQNVGIIQVTNSKVKIIKKSKFKKLSKTTNFRLILHFALSAASKFHRLIDPMFKKQKNNSIYIYKNK